MRYLRAFGAFWYDFLVGDRPELFVGPILALVLAWLAVVARVPAAAAGILLFVCVLAVGSLSLYLTARPRS
ncbi:MAG: hypothetical protein ACP5VP_01075 [Candidatus Limnocylindrales bacterium]